MVRKLKLYAVFAAFLMLCGCGSEEADSQSSLTEDFEYVNEQEVIQRIEIAQESMDYEPETQQETLVRFTAIAPLFSDDKIKEIEASEEEIKETYEFMATEEIAAETVSQTEADETVTETQEQTEVVEAEEKNPEFKPVG